MEQTQNLDGSHVVEAWAQLQNQAEQGEALPANAYRLAFADPEFLLRRETRGIRIQLEMLKPDLEQQAQGIDDTVVVFGSARYCDADAANKALATATAKGDAGAIATANKLVRNAKYYALAREFGQLVANYSAAKPAAQKLFICTGGGPGIMEAANRGAHDRGAPTVGLNITLPMEQSGNPYVTPSLSFKFHYFALRKMHFMMRAKALVACPGGFGTLDELFEILTLVQTRKVKPLPIVLFGSDYWKRLINFDFLVEEGAISAADLKLFHYADTPAEAWSFIQAFYQL